MVLKIISRDFHSSCSKAARHSCGCTTWTIDRQTWPSGLARQRRDAMSASRNLRDGASPIAALARGFFTALWFHRPPPGSIQRILFTCTPNPLAHRPAPHHRKFPPKQRTQRLMQQRRRQPRRPWPAFWRSGRLVVVAAIPKDPPTRRRHLRKRLRTQNLRRPRTAAIKRRLRPCFMHAPYWRRVRSGSAAPLRMRPNWPGRHSRAASPASSRQPSKCGR